MRNLLIVISNFFIALLFYIFRVFPLRRKVVAAAFWGRIYGDNPKPIVEKLHEIDDNIDMVWLKRTFAGFSVPQWMRVVPPMSRDNNFMGILKAVYEMSTAKVWISSSGIPKGCRKREGQLYIETFHGGLGIKKIMDDCNSDAVRKIASGVGSVLDADVMISQSDHLTNIYRRAFHYNGPVFKCGYPKNDIFFNDNRETANAVKESLSLKNENIFLYVPTFRDYFRYDFDLSCYQVDYNALKLSLEKRFGGPWTILVKWHPNWVDKIKEQVILPSGVLDVSDFSDTQQLILAADAAMTDYSSTIFDAALKRIPCFTFATDFEKYMDERGVYYTMDELPFPCARSNQELVDNIINFNFDNYIMKWDAFVQKMGLYEPGNASEVIAGKVLDFLDGIVINWN